MNAIAPQIASPRFGIAVQRILAFLVRHAGFHAPGALGLDMDCPDERAAIALLVERGWVGEINSMLGVTKRGFAAYVVTLRAVQADACSNFECC